jgi:hypothetical protein
MTSPTRRTASLSRISSGPVILTVLFERRASRKAATIYGDKIFHGQRPDRFLFYPHKPKNGKRIQRVAQVVQHMVAAAINHSCLENRAVKA